jgi:hypothetical protein
MRFRAAVVSCVVLSLVIVSACATRVAVREHRDRRIIARDMIKRTAFVIRVARRDVNEHRVYTGDLARAIAHQKFAKSLFYDGEYLKAMYQTKWARHLAAKAIIANRGEVPPQANLTSEELSLTANGPSGEQLDRELHAAMPSEPMQDEAAVRLNADVDLR